MDSGKLELLKNKEEQDHSAASSPSVRKHLASFLRAKRQVSSSQVDIVANTTICENNQRQQPQQTTPAQGTNSRLNHSAGLSNGQAQEVDHPLRKTASLPAMHSHKAPSFARRHVMQRRTTVSPLTKPTAKLLNGLDGPINGFSSNPCIGNVCVGGLGRREIRSQSQSSSPPPQQHQMSKHQQRRHLKANQNTSASIPTSSSRSIMKANSVFTPGAKISEPYFSTSLNSPPMAGHWPGLLRQHHTRLSEVLKRSVYQRASTSRGRLPMSGSLDIDASQTTKTGNGSASNLVGLPASSEHRQWSLDSSDLRAPSTLQKIQQFGYLSPIDFHKLRLATTSDAAAMRRSRSPSSSISMGLTGGQTAASVSQPSGQPRAHPKEPEVLVTAHGKHLSSSSSSNSSSISQQDSLEECSSQAIDLSNSSEASRQRLYGPPAGSGEFSSQTQLYQLQEGMKHLIMSSSQPQQPRRDVHLSHPPPLSANHKMAASLDAPNHPIDPMVSLADQFNLSASAQNLLAIREQPPCDVESLFASHHHHHHLNHQQQQQQQQQEEDANYWLLASNNLMQSPDLQQSNQINGSLITKITNLPEPHKTALLARLIQQQPFHLLNSMGNGAATTPTAPLNRLAHQRPDDQRALIGRALSSPLLISSVEATMQPVDLDGLASRPGQQEMHVELTPRGLNACEPDVQLPADSEMLVDSETGDNRSSPRADNLDSLDLSVSSSRSSVSGKQHQVAVNFRYEPAEDLERALSRFIYNPVFARHSTTGLVYELEMCKHKCICGIEQNHLESSHRILAIWRRLFERGLMAKCARVPSRKATLEELQLCHSEVYSNYFGRSPYERIKLSRLDLSKLPIEGLTQLECGGQGADIDTAWNEELTPGAARLAAGCVIEAAVGVARGVYSNAFAVVRPPGLHAEHQQAVGFCFFNSVAIAAKVLQRQHNVGRVLIVDWDVHHGHGIERIFYEDKSVMYISLHRHDEGNFFPGTGAIHDVGLNAGEGYNWNVAWSSSRPGDDPNQKTDDEYVGDAEYLAAFRTIVMPIAREFDPSMVLVACGFDAARGHPNNLGGYDLSPACFAYLTKQLMTLANGRIVLCLEGGYQLSAIGDCAETCVRALLCEPPVSHLDQIQENELRRRPTPRASEVLVRISNLAGKYWPAVERWRESIHLSAVDEVERVT